MRRPLTVALAALTTVGLAACSAASDGAGGSDGGTDGVQVVATTTILGDVVGDIVACGGGSATTLLPVGADPHDFSPSSEQVAQLVSADLVVAVGLGLEGGLGDALASAQADGATVLELAPLVDPIEFGAGGHSDEEHADEEHAHGSLDPHFWFDMARMATAAEAVGEQLATTTGDAAFTACGEQVAADILAAEAEVRATLDTVPVDRRVLVTDHDALGYLAEAYGYRIAGTVIPSGTTLAEPSSADLAALAQTIRDEQVPAIFTNLAAPTALAEAVAAETGTEVAVLPLFVDSLGAPDSQASSYIDLMKADAATIASGLRG